jgi:hypothetical protein
MDTILKQDITVYTAPWTEVPTGTYMIYVGDNEQEEGSVERDQHNILHIMWAKGGHILLTEVDSTTILRPIKVANTRQHSIPPQGTQIR